MSINDISTCLKGGKSCGIGQEEDANSPLWCEQRPIALCSECDTNLLNSKNFRHGHPLGLLLDPRTKAVRKCEHGSNIVPPGLILRSSPPESRKRSSKKNSGHRSSSSRKDLLPNGKDAIAPCDVGEEKSGTSDAASLAFLPTCEKAASSAIIRSALRGGYEEAGLGSRPKLSVTWHPDVKEPICRIASHTVGHKRAPVFLSRHSHQKQLRQKSKTSSKSQRHAKKQERNKKSEPVKTRYNVMPNANGHLVLDLESRVPTEDKPIDSTWSNRAYCIQEEGLCDSANMSSGSIGDPCLQSVLLESIVCPENLTDKIVEHSNAVEMDDKKSSTSATDEGLNESLPEDYRQVLGSMFHAFGQGVEMHAPSANLSRSKQVFKQATEGKFLPLISVV